MLTQEQLLAFNVIQRRLTRHNVTLRFNDQTGEVVNIADHNRANHRTRALALRYARSISRIG